MNSQSSIALADQITLKNGAVLWLRRSQRARRIRLTVNAQGRAELVLPPRTSLRAAVQFAESNRRWVEQQIGKHAQQAEVADAATEPDALGRATKIPLRGVPTPVIWGQTASAMLDGANIVLPGNGGIQQLLNHLRAEAKGDAQQAINALAPALGRWPKRLTIRDQKTLWGSLSGRDCLSLNCRLVMAPPHVLHYVVAHEMAHLVHRNHSKRFWALCEQLDPNTPVARRWLREHGNRLRLVLPQ